MNKRTSPVGSREEAVGFENERGFFTILPFLIFFGGEEIQQEIKGFSIRDEQSDPRTAENAQGGRVPDCHARGPGGRVADCHARGPGGRVSDRHLRRGQSLGSSPQEGAESRIVTSGGGRVTGETLGNAGDSPSGNPTGFQKIFEMVRRGFKMRFK